MGKRVFSVTKALRGRDDAQHHFDLGSFADLFKERKNADYVNGFIDGTSTVNLTSIINTNVYQTMGSVIQFLRRGNPAKAYDVLFAMALLAFKDTVDRKLLCWFMAFVMNPSIREIEPPPHPGYLRFDPSETTLSEERLKSLIMQNLPQTSEVPARKRKKLGTGTSSPVEEPEARETAVMSLVVQLVQSWPFVPKSLQEFRDLEVDDPLEQIDIEVAWLAVEPEFQRLTQNTALIGYADKVDRAMHMLFQAQEMRLRRNPNSHAWFSFNQKPLSLKRSRPEEQTKPSYRLPRLAGGLSLKASGEVQEITARAEVNMIDLTGDDEPEVIVVDADDVAKEVEVIDLDADTTELPKELGQLSSIIQTFANSADATRKRYGQDLQESLLALTRSKPRTPGGGKEALTPSEIFAGVSQARLDVRRQLTILKNMLSANEAGHSWLKYGNLWPALSPVSLLELLREKNSALVSKDLKAALVAYGVQITNWQRLLRLQDDRVSAADICNAGHENWNPDDHTEWLLLEIDNNILIRPGQVEVARAIIDPPSGGNSVLQMNMGQGMCLICNPYCS
jgi:hypothetical protein